jgi:hypothetical protein
MEIPAARPVDMLRIARDGRASAAIRVRRLHERPPCHPSHFLSFVNSAHFGNVEFNEQDDGCVWNIKVDWANYNESVLWKNVNLCRFNVLRLRYDPGSKTTSFIAE